MPIVAKRYGGSDITTCVGVGAVNPERVFLTRIGNRKWRGVQGK